jgi:hypothetical protein
MQSLSLYSKAMEEEEKDKKEERRERRYKRRKAKIEPGSKKDERFENKYGYNYKAAIEAGLEPKEEGEHWDSRHPETGEILKGRRHPTVHKTKAVERSMGYKIRRVKGRLYSYPKQ